MPKKLKMILGNVRVFDSNNQEVKPIKEKKIINNVFNEYSLLLGEIYTITSNKSCVNYTLKISNIKQLENKESLDLKSFKGFDKKHIILVNPIIDLWLQKKFTKRILYFDYLKLEQVLLIITKDAKILSEGYRLDYEPFLSLVFKKYDIYYIKKGNLTSFEKMQKYIYGNVIPE